MEIPLQLAGGFLIGLVAAISPGPDTVLVLRSVAVGGTRAGLRAAAGIGTALALLAACTVLLVSGVRDLAGSYALKAVQLAGAAYLAYLGFLLLRASFAVQPVSALTPEGDRPGNHYFQQGFVTNLTNPKAIVFFGSVVSQFITGRNISSGVAVLVGVVAAVLAWFFLLSYAAARVIGRLTSSRQRVVDTIAGVLFLGLACFGLATAL